MTIQPRSEASLHEIDRLERRMRLFYFLRDLGLLSAEEPARLTFDTYMVIVGKLIG